MSIVAPIRPLRDSDSLVSLTDLLHRAYAPLASLGLNYTGVDQTVEETAMRISRGKCAVAEIDGKVVGTITVIGARPDRGTPWYREPYVASAHQFAVEPTLQGRGIGSALMSSAESWAPDHGYSQLAVDTAESAHHLIAYYAKRGYRFVEFAQWPGKRYRSIVYSKELPMSGRGDR
jgi:GNAT superfamily N-acetyltransferase